MARTKKNKLQSFTHDVGMRNDLKIKALRRRFGLNGYAVWNLVLETLAGSDYLVFCYNDTTCELMALDFEISADELREIIDYCVKLNLFQITEDGILKCNNLYERFLSGKRGNPALNRGEENPYYSDKKDDSSQLVHNWSQLKTNWSNNAPINVQLEHNCDKDTAKEIEKRPQNAQKADFESNAEKTNSRGETLFGPTSEESGKRKRERTKENKEKDNNNNNNYSYCSSRKVNKEGLGEKEEEQELIASAMNVLFFRNYPKPYQEFLKIIDYNNLRSTPWRQMSREARLSAVNLWNQRPVQPPRFKPKVLELWQKLYSASQSLPSEQRLPCLDFLSDDLKIEISGNTLYIICHNELQNHIEHNLKLYAPIIRASMPELHFSQVMYTLLPDETKETQERCRT